MPASEHCRKLRAAWHMRLGCILMYLGFMNGLALTRTRQRPPRDASRRTRTHEDLVARQGVQTLPRSHPRSRCRHRPLSHPYPLLHPPAIAATPIVIAPHTITAMSSMAAMPTHSSAQGHSPTNNPHCFPKARHSGGTARTRPLGAHPLGADGQHQGPGTVCPTQGR